MKRLRGIEAVGARIAQRADDVEKLHHRTRPAVQQDQRPRGWLGRFDVQEMHRLAVDLGAELRVGVELRLLGAPVELIQPSSRPVAGRNQREPRAARCARQLLGQRVAASRAFRSARSASGIAMRNGSRVSCVVTPRSSCTRNVPTSREFAEISTGKERSRALGEWES